MAGRQSSVSIPQNLTVTSSKFGGTNLAHAPASIIFADRDSPNFTVSCNTIDGGGNGAGSSLDAEAIGEAAMRPTMRFVEVKGQAQSDIQALHRARERLVPERTALINHLRALLLERGIVAQADANWKRNSRSSRTRMGSRR
jgi:Transposase